MAYKAIAILVTVLLLTNYLQPNISENLQKDTGDGKVKIDFYSESLCPDCLAFIRGTFKTAVNTPDFWKIC
jgi:hypothetical protein